MRPARVVVTIDELAVEGVTHAQSGPLVAALERGLADLLATRLPLGASRGGSTSRITSPLSAARTPDGRSIGAEAARALYRGLGG